MTIEHEGRRYEVVGWRACQVNEYFLSPDGLQVLQWLGGFPTQRRARSAPASTRAIVLPRRIVVRPVDGQATRPDRRKQAAGAWQTHEGVRAGERVTDTAGEYEGINRLVHPVDKPPERRRDAEARERLTLLGWQPAYRQEWRQAYRLGQKFGRTLGA